MGKTFKCGECGTKYSTPGNIPPPSPNWADGHVCIMMEVIESLIPAVESKISSTKFRQPGKQIGSMLAHSYENMKTGVLIVGKEASERVFGYVNSGPKPLQTGTPIISYDEDAGEDRMKIIGQNGNTGEHYDNVDPDAELPPVKDFVEFESKKERTLMFGKEDDFNG